MAEKFDPKETTDVQELVVNMAYTEEAIVRLLEWNPCHVPLIRR